MLDLSAMDVAISLAPARRFSLRIIATFDDKLFQIFQEKGVILFDFVNYQF